MNNLEFNWRYKDYGMRATPKRLARFNEKEKNETIDFIKYYKDTNSDKEFCYSIGYFYYYEKERSWEFKFVGDRFTEIDSEDIKIIWDALKMSYKVLENWKMNDDK